MSAPNVAGRPRSRTAGILAAAVAAAAVAAVAALVLLRPVPVPAPSDSPSSAAPARLLVHDFDGETLARPGVSCRTWALDTRAVVYPVDFRAVPCDRPGAAGRALRLAYAWHPDSTTIDGFFFRLDRLDASAFDRLEFWVKGDTAAGFAPSFQVEVKKPNPHRAGETLRGSFVVDGIGPAWRLVSIPLRKMTGLADWTGLEEIAFVFHSRRGRAGGDSGAYLLDDVAFVRTGDPGPGIYDTIPVPRKRAWEAAHGGEGATASAIRARLRGWPSIHLADTAALPADDRAFLLRVARDTWRGLDSLCDSELGLPLDTVRFGETSTDLEASRIGDYTNVTNIGVYLLCVVGARELDFLTRDEAVDRLARILGTLERLETHDGFFFNYYDTTSGERTSHFVSFVDSAWLTAGLMAVRQAFAELAPRCGAIIDRQDYRFFYDEVEELMNHGYYANLGVRAEYHYGALYTEARAGSLIAIGKGDVPEEHWFRMFRTFPESWGWQSMKPRGRAPKRVRGHEFSGGFYEWKGERYVPSWGGSLFEALMPTICVDEERIAPRSLGRNDRVHALLHRRYATEELGLPVWGMSPCSVPDTDSYGEYGAWVLGSYGYKVGAVTPHVVGLAAPFMPAEAAACLREMARRYPIYGEYGFYDSVNPSTGRVAYKYLALDQSMLFLGLANHLGDGCVRRHFMADPIARRAAAVVGEEDFLR